MVKLVMTLSDDTVQEYPLDKGCIAVGRNPDNDICLDDHTVSNHHADILVHQNIYLEDCKSTNGTHLNGRLITRGRLKHGDVVHFGKLKFSFVDRNSDDFRIELNANPEPPNTVSEAEVVVPTVARVRVLNGSRAGEEQLLDKAYNTVGMPGVQVAVIAKRTQGYFLVPVTMGHDEIITRINGAEVGAASLLLKDGYVLEIADMKLEFLLSDQAHR